MTGIRVLSFPLEADVARLAAIVENDRDVAHGRPTTGFELDDYERMDRKLLAAIDRMTMYGATRTECAR